jgi:hypothetical protein
MADRSSQPERGHGAAIMIYWTRYTADYLVPLGSRPWPISNLPSSADGGKVDGPASSPGVSSTFPPAVVAEPPTSALQFNSSR